MKNYTIFFIFFLVVFLSFTTMAQIPASNLLLWLKADEGVDTLNGKVSTWHDQSGNGNDAVQSNESRQPQFLAGALNGIPVIHFDGTDDRLALTGSTTMSRISLFLVFKIDSGLVGNPTSNPQPYYPITFGTFDITGKGYGLSMRNWFSENSPNIIDPFVGEESYVQAESPNIAAYDQWKVLSVVTDQTMWNTTVRSNGVDAVITPEGTSNTPLSVPLGVPEGYTGLGGADNVPHGQLIFKGDIAEVVVYDTVLSESDRLAVENYLADKYKISIPTDGLQLWLKADEGVDTLNGTVNTWHDQSGNGNDAVQSNESRQPQFLAGALNSEPVLHFDGIDDHLSLTGSTTMSRISLFVVFKIDSGLVGNPNSDPLPYYPIVLSEYGLSMRNFFSNNSPDIIDPFIGEESWVQAEASNIAAYDQWKVLSVVTNQNMWSTTLRSNGVDAVITPEGTSNLPLSTTLGRTDGSDGIGGADNVPAGHLIFKGDIAEVVVYDTVLSESERLAVENYLADKYNISVTTGIEDSRGENIPEQFNLSQNYPNPFNPSTKINYQISTAGIVSLKVYDVLGKEVATLVNEEKPVGSYEVNFNASRLSSGMYLYRLKAGNFVETKKMILLK